MRSRVFPLLLALAIGAGGAEGAHAAVTAQPVLDLPAFAKAETDQLGSRVTLRFVPATFSPPSSADQLNVGWGPLGGGAASIRFLYGSNAGTTSSLSVDVQDGEQLLVSMAACVAASPSHCQLLNTVTGLTRVDATPPGGTVQINGGAVATSSRDVTLSLAATDPLIGGIPGSSSGVTQYAVDEDGEGTFPCPLFPDPAMDQSGCARDVAATGPASLSAGDGVKTVGVSYGDGARDVHAPCIPPPGVFCAILLTNPFILGNLSPVATDTIILDTLKPVALATQDRFTVDRGGPVSFDAGTSVDQNPGIGAGVDLGTATWNFKDGTAPATGQKVTHTFTQTGTFVGELRVRDRAGNQSDPRALSVTVNPRPGDVAAGGGSVGAITSRGTAAFGIDRVKVNARYAKSKLKGTITLEGTSAQAGALTAELRPPGKGKLRRLAGKVGVGTFTLTLKLPADLLPGTYRLDFVGPGGTLNSSLKLSAPREGVLRSGRVSASARRALARFTLAAQPAKALRGRLTVSWAQGTRKLGLVKVVSGARITAGLPGRATLVRGKVIAQLRAGGIVVGEATARPSSEP